MIATSDNFTILRFIPFNSVYNTPHPNRYPAFLFEMDITDLKKRSHHTQVLGFG